MPDDPAATATATPPAETQPAEPPPTDDEPLGEAGEKALDAWKQRARAAESQVKELSPLAQKARDLEEANKSELDKATSQRDVLKSERDEKAAENLRLRVALEKKLPSELIDRLQGNSKEEIEADADELLKLVKPADATDFDGGARTAATDEGAASTDPKKALGSGLLQALERRNR